MNSDILAAASAVHVSAHLRSRCVFWWFSSGDSCCLKIGLSLPVCASRSYTSKYVSVRVENVHVKLSSWDHAVSTLADAEEARKAYWCSLIETVQHPSWWPTTGHVPTYDQVRIVRNMTSWQQAATYQNSQVQQLF